MREVEVELYAVNVEALDAEARALFGWKCAGVRANVDGVCILLEDEATADDERRAKELLLAHDPRKLTKQQMEDLTYQQELDIARREMVDKPRNTDAALNWLVLEVAELVKRRELAAGVLPPQGSQQQAQAGDNHQPAKDG